MYFKIVEVVSTLNLVSSENEKTTTACNCFFLDGGGGGGDVVETNIGAFLLTPSFIDIKYPKHIAVCDTNTVILLRIKIIIDT